ncbi:MAG: hypothetical protein K2H53_03485 [Clostridia bacterium]|nr:hypothetical protein [Clostridia bacterium]
MKETSNGTGTIDPELENVTEKLRQVRWRSHDKFPNVILDFVDYMADIAKKDDDYYQKVIAERVVLLIDKAKRNIQASQLGIEQKNATVPVPENLKEKGAEINKKLPYLILVIDEIASVEFSKRFRELFIMLYY